MVYRVHATTAHLMVGRRRREQLPCSAIELDVVSWVYTNTTVGANKYVPRGAVVVVRRRRAEPDVDAAIMGVMVL